mgnify:CR=1 FL=1
MRKLNQGKKGNKIDVERYDANADLASEIIKQNDQYNDNNLCNDCINEKNQMRRNLKNMNNEEIHRNQTAVTFTPCSVCRQEGSIYSNNNEYQTGKYSGEPDHEPVEVSKKQINYETVDKTLMSYLFVRPQDLEVERQPIDRSQYTQ